MEQQEQTIHKAEERRTEEQTASQAPRQRSPSPGWAAQAILAGSRIEELPPQTLEELAAQVGNSAMLTRLARRAKEPAQAQLTARTDPAATPPLPGPALDCPTSEPSGLTEEPWSGEAADPMGLT